MLEQEMASIIKFTLDNSGNPNPYYHDMPESFRVPAAYFPRAEIASDGDTLTTYALDYMMHIYFFASSREGANELALSALSAIKAERNAVPLIDNNGEPTGKFVRIKDPDIKMVDTGAAKLFVRWTSRRPYNSTMAEHTKVSHVHVNNWMKTEKYTSNFISAEDEAAYP